MGLRQLRPMTNGQRNMSVLDGVELTAKKPSVKSLLKVGRKVTGRNNGTISIRHRGGGTRARYRPVDFKRTDKLGIPGKVFAVEYDPNRNVYVALVNYVDGEKRYVLMWKGCTVGEEIVCDLKTKEIKDGKTECSFRISH